MVPSEINVRMSILPAVAVIVGAPAVGHFTPVKVAVPLPVLAACLRSNTKDLPAVAVGIVNVQAVEAVRVAVMTVPDEIAIVAELVTVPRATTVSVYALTVGLVSVGLDSVALEIVDEKPGALEPLETST